MESIEQKSAVLAFEEFARLDVALGIPRYNNFFLHFFDDAFFGPMYREKPYFQKFQKEHPELVAELTEKIGTANRDLGTLKALKPFEKDMYEAYKLIKQYGVSDQELFT